MPVGNHVIRHFVVAVTGASGSIYGLRLISELLRAGERVSLILTLRAARFCIMKPDLTGLLALTNSGIWYRNILPALLLIVWPLMTSGRVLPAALPLLMV